MHIITPPHYIIGLLSNLIGLISTLSNVSKTRRLKSLLHKNLFSNSSIYIIQPWNLLSSEAEELIVQINWDKCSSCPKDLSHCVLKPKTFSPQSKLPPLPSGDIRVKELNLCMEATCLRKVSRTVTFRHRILVKSANSCLRFYLLCEPWLAIAEHVTVAWRP